MSGALVFTSSMVHCPSCYQNSPVCVHGDTPATACAFFTPDASVVRQANGDYPQTFRSTLPSEVRALDASNIDSVPGYTPAVAVPTILSVEETALAADMTTLAFTNMGHALSLAEKTTPTRVAHQMYSWIGRTKRFRRFRKAPRVTDIVARGQVSGPDQ